MGDHNYTICTWVLQSTFTYPKAGYHVLRVVLTPTLLMTNKARNIAHRQIKTRNTACAGITSNPCRTRQSLQATLVPSAFLSASSGTFNSLFKVLFIFPSWYLFAIGLELIFSLRWNLPPTLRSNPEERDSANICRTRKDADDKRDSHPRWFSFPRGLHQLPR